MRKQDDNSRLVYSTDQGRIEPEKHQDVYQGSEDGIVRIVRSVKGRRGKPMCVIQGLPLDKVEMAQLASELKKMTGTGGSVKQNTIEIQGDKREQLQQYLIEKGYKVKLAGG